MQTDPRIPTEALSELARRYGLDSVIERGEEYARVIDMILSAAAGMPPLAPAADAPAAAVRRAGEQDDPLNAVVHWCDAAATGSGLLDGLRITVKDSVAVAGVPQTAGFSGLIDHIPAEHSEIVRRLLASGASICATTNMDAFGMAATGESSSYGRTLNPVDPARVSGGSSSGAAASLGYPGVDAAIGTDQGGSIRIPASWSGCLGLKPTFGLVPYTGIAGIDQAVDHVGPLSRDTETMARLLQVTAGYDPGDPRQRPRQGDDYLAELDRFSSGLSGLRIGVVSEGFASESAEERATTAAVRAAIERMAGEGATVTEVSVPLHLQTGGVGFAIFHEGMAAVLRDNGQNYGLSGRYDPAFATAMHEALGRSIEEMSPQMKVALIAGSYMHDTWGGERYARARRLQSEVRTGYERLFADFDVLAMPTTPYVATLPFAEEGIDGRIGASWDNLRNTAPFNVSGHPAISLPLAEAEGLPAGVMLVGPLFADALLLQIAYACEQRLGWRGTPARRAQ